MNKLIVLFLSFMFLGCSSSAPKNSDGIYSKITTKHDKFDNKTWIETPLYRISQGFTDTFPVRVKYRALYENKKRKFIQLVVISTNVDWGFYHSAKGEDGYSFEFNEVDNYVDSTGGVTTQEVYGLTLPLSYLRKVSVKDWNIKVYGRRNDGVFILPKTLSLAMLKKINCIDENICV